MIDQERDSRDMVFGMLLISEHKQGFELFSHLRRIWFDLAHHQKLFDCANEMYSNQKPFDLLTAINYFNSNKLFTKHFTPVNISKLTANISFCDPFVFDSLIGNIVHQYEFRLSRNLYEELGRLTLGGIFSVVDALKHAQSFIDTINDENVSEIEENNAEIIDRVIEQHDKASIGEIDGIRLGFRSMEEIIIEPVDFAVFAARPSMGKTAFAVSVLRNMIFELGYNVVFFSLEMSKEQIMRRLLSNITGINAQSIKMGKMTADERKLIESIKARKEWKNLTIYEDSHRPSDVIRKTSKLNSKTPLHCIIVDYLQKLQKENPKSSEFEHVSNASNQMKLISQNMKIPVIALAQLSRSNETRGGDKRPLLSDLRHSGDIEQDASLVGFLHRPEYYGIKENEAGDSTENIGEVIIAKYREGALAIHEMEINPKTIRWQDKTQNVVMSFNTPAMQPNIEFDSKNESPF